MERLFDTIIARMDTLPLQQGGMPTRALVVFNPGEAVCGRARFTATFPMRRENCPQPVTVRDCNGCVVPSRLTVSSLEEQGDLPAGRVLWRMELEFIAENIPAQSWQAYAATFGFSLESQSEEVALFDALPLLPLIVRETECHAGDLPLSGTMVRYSTSENTLPL